jgi:DNA recombination protein RmuC
MEMTYLIIGCMPANIGSHYFILHLKSSTVSRSSYDELNFLHIKNKSDLENSTAKIQELNQHLNKEKELNIQQQDLLNDLKNEFAKLSAQHSSLNIQFQEQKQISIKAGFPDRTLSPKNRIFLLKTLNFLLRMKICKNFKYPKEEILQNTGRIKLQFENLANKILEEKTEKFTTLNQNNLKNILEPFQEKITDLKNKSMKLMKKKIKNVSLLQKKLKNLQN